MKIGQGLPKAIYFSSVSPSGRRSTAQRPTTNSAARLLGFKLFRRAAAVIQPSLFEGWSALVEDARTLGKRIYVSDIPVHREQQPTDGVFFHPDRPEELAELVARDWPDLKPGPDLVRESEAHVQQRSRALAFARAFHQIVKRTTAET